MTGATPRGIAVLDVGATNTKALLFDAGLALVREESIPSRKAEAPPYPAIATAPILDFAARVLPAFDAEVPVDAVVPCTHGSAFALLDAAGAPVLPVMDYNARPPEDVAAGYAAVAPSFAEVLAPINPGALTVGRQFYWQETAFPDAFARCATILPLAQYLAFRLGGRAVSEATSLGAQTQLWDLRGDRPSSLARARGWDRLLAPVEPAWRAVGTLSDSIAGPGFRGRGAILAGIHDSSANYLRYLGGEAGRFALLSTGTWIIGFDAGADPGRLDPACDTACGLTVHGATVPICRFKGGEEYALLAGEDAPAPEIARVAALVGRGTMALPSFTDSGGPVPGSGGRGTVEGTVEDAADRAALAALYCAQMTALALERLAGPVPAPRIIVDGPFGLNPGYLACLAALLPGASVLASDLREGTAAGAALLALADDEGRFPDLPVSLVPAPAADLPGLGAHHARWRARVDEIGGG